MQIGKGKGFHGPSHHVPFLGYLRMKEFSSCLWCSVLFTHSLQPAEKNKSLQNLSEQEWYFDCLRLFLCILFFSQLMNGSFHFI